jgi:hypothetical protein
LLESCATCMIKKSYEMYITVSCSWGKSSWLSQMQHIITVAYICRIIHQFVDILCFLCSYTLPVRELGLFLMEENVLELNFLCFLFYCVPFFCRNVLHKSANMYLVLFLNIVLTFCEIVHNKWPEAVVIL